jgi:hypothetical protein
VQIRSTSDQRDSEGERKSIFQNSQFQNEERHIPPQQILYSKHINLELERM